MSKKKHSNNKKHPARRPAAAIPTGASTIDPQPTSPLPARRPKKTASSKAAIPKGSTRKTAKPRRPATRKQPTPIVPPTAPLPAVSVPPPAPSATDLPVQSAAPMPLLARLRQFIAAPRFGELFSAGSLTVLFCTTLYWTVLSARLQSLNADQLIDSYLFGSAQTFHDAVFPATHSFLLKWPLFIIMQLFGDSRRVFMAATIVFVLLTVGVLVWLLHRIERRPAVFGLLCLALSSVLLLVPAQPYPGGLLPVNMAMTTTRNLEYALYLLTLYWAVRAGRLKSWQFYGVTAAVMVIVASDRLFAALAVGAALLTVLWHSIVLGKRLQVTDMARWLTAAVIGSGAATVLVAFIGRLGITNFANEQVASPYAAAHSLSQLAIGVIYAVGGVATNFGANPVHTTIEATRLPHDALHSLSQLAIIPYAVNAILLLAGITATIQLLRRRGQGTYQDLSLLLIASSIVAVIVFVVTDHYYPADARYLTIVLFALFVAAATYLAGLVPRMRYIYGMALVLLAVLPLSLLTTWREYHTDEVALAGKQQVTARVSDELTRHKVGRLIGDYWDVIPVKAVDPQKLTVSPVEQCRMPRQVLTSRAWYPHPSKIKSASNSAAYLAVKDPVSPGRIPSYGGCSLARVVGTYGTPSSRIVITPTSQPHSDIGDTPDVLLLLYNGGIQPVPKPRPATPPADAGPAEPEAVVPFTDRDTCKAGTTMQVVAHEDDDLLFMNPDLVHDIVSGRCIRTVYMTAGDAGEQIGYWGQREKGAKAAYAQMFGLPDSWQDQTQLAAGHKVTVSYLDGMPRVALTFMRLPDGNVHGNGFPGHGNQSLHGLLSGALPTIDSVDGTASYSHRDLVATLHDIMTNDLPDQIRIQGSEDQADGDHADHHDSGILTREAATDYIQPHTITAYLGYPDKVQAANLSDDDITRKQAAFLAYAKFDGAVCQSAYECQNTYTYGSYLTRQYPL